MELEDSAFIDFDCPYCKSTISYPEDFASTVQGCPNCHAEMIVARKSGEPGRPVPIPYQTPRLVLRRLLPNDWKDLLEYYADEELFRHDFREAMQEEEVLHWLEKDSQRGLSQPGPGLTLGVALEESEKLIGEVNLRISEADPQQGSVSICINRNFHRQGYGSETLASMLVFCFREIGLRRVTAVCDSRNSAGLGLLSKVGFRREGEFVKNQFLKGDWINTVWSAMLSEEYEQRTQSPKGT
jgi:aminoglycoside 6'-N-acetyltransferase